MAKARPARAARPASTAPRRLVVAVTGATGTLYGVRLLQLLRGTDVETHLVVSRWGARTLIHETPFSLADVQKLATRAYPAADQGAAISSGSFLTLGMAIVPCSMRTLAAVAHGLADNLVHRAADVVLKERRRLILVPRETPLSLVHLRNLTLATEAGAVVLPAAPGFYHKPQQVRDLVDFVVQRLLDHLGLEINIVKRWEGK